VFETALVTTQTALAELAIARDPASFTTLAMGRAGIGGLYDLWRRMIAGLRGQQFQDRHRGEPAEPGRAIKGELA
jgi:hypothetical protein